jgi:HlyD family secretion protein
VNTSLKKVPRDTRLTPGMTLIAEIKVSERTVISYFLYPLVKAFDEGMREP